MKKSRWMVPAIIISMVLIVCLFGRVAGIFFMDIIELKTIDLRFHIRGPEAPNPDVVLVVVDEKSLAQEGKWAWARSKIGRLVRKLSNAGARVIAFDIGFLEPDQTDRDVIGMIQRIKTHVQRLGPEFEVLSPFLTELAAKADNDLLLADALETSKADVTLGYFFQMGDQPIDEDEQIDIFLLDGSLYNHERYTSVKAQAAPLITAVSVQNNIPIIAEAAAHSGYFNIFPDADGSVRRAAAAIRFDGALYASLSLKAASAYLDAPLAIQVAAYGVDTILIGDRRVAVDELGQMVINYRGPKKTFPHISATDILNDRTPPSAIQDKLVLVGVTAAGIYDLRVTPYGTVFPGVEVHANIIDNLLSGDILKQPAWLAILDMLAMILFAVVLGAALPRLEAVGGTALALALLLGYLFLCQYLFVRSGFILNIVYPVSVILLTSAGITLHRYLSETRQKRFIRDAFSTYLAPSVVRQLIDHPDRLVLGGEERVITAFFSDVEGFTSISEKLAPKDLVALLNEFLTEMTDITLKWEGTVDKFEGDAIIAFFGAPNSLENQARSACMACLEMQQRLAELREAWRAQNQPLLKMRIGLHTGPAVVGNMGSKNRMDYTMMGDTVNTAARMESVNKYYGTYTLIGERTRQEAGEDIICREIDAIRLMGRTEAVAIYEPLGLQGEVDDGVLQIINAYEKGLAAYRQLDWTAAAVFFKQAVEISPEDGPSKTLLARCQAYQNAPPPADWDGAFVMTSK